MHPFSASHADIQGVWRIDTDLTTKFNATHSNLEDSHKALLPCMASNSYIEIQENNLVFYMGEYSCLIDGKEQKIDGYDIEYKIQYIYEDDTTVVLRSVEDEYIELVHIVNKDLIWIYYPGEKPNHNIHLRYYYKRIASEIIDLI